MEQAKDFKPQRAELLAQLFLQDLGAGVWTARGDMGPFDSIAVFQTDEKKLRMIAVEVKSTEQPVGQEFRFKASPGTIRSLHHSNVPVLFLVVDVKRNEVFFGWASDIRFAEASLRTRAAATCILPVTSAAEGKNQLLDTILSQPDSSEKSAVG